jgi:hypothetical protein
VRASGNGPRPPARYGQNDRAIAIGRKNYLFAGSDAGGRRVAAMYSLIESAKLNGLNPQHYLADLLARIADHSARRIAELLPWNWQPLDATRAAALSQPTRRPLTLAAISSILHEWRCGIPLTSSTIWFPNQTSRSCF